MSNSVFEFLDSDVGGTPVAVGPPIGALPEFVYTLRVELIPGPAVQPPAPPVPGKLQFTLVPSPGAEPPPGARDHALDMRIKGGADARLTIRLSDDLDWYFPKNPIRLLSSTGVNIPDIKDRYPCLEPVVWPQKCKQLSLKASYTIDPNDLGRTVVNIDRINIVVALNQWMRDPAMPSDEPLYLVIDPGIKNPGDDP